MDNQSIVAALLHDIIEDTEVTYETVEQLFSAPRLQSLWTVSQSSVKSLIIQERSSRPKI